MRAENEIKLLSCECITPFGTSLQTWQALCDGLSNLKQTPLFGNEGDETVPLSLFEPMAAVLPPRWLQRVLDMLQAVSGPEWGRIDTPIFIASSNFGVDSLYYYRHEGHDDQLPYAVPHDCVEQIRQRMGWSHNVSLYSHACVSAHIATLAATRAIEAGAHQALVVCYDFVSPFVTGGFNALKILNGTLPKPFHAGQTGSIALGEGAGYAVLGKEGTSNFHIASQSTWNEMHHFTANEPEGSGFSKVLEPMTESLSKHKFWIKGHGTGTLDAGQLEAGTLARLYPQAPLTGWKGSIGHTLGSCGMVEMAISCRCMENGRVPGTVGGERPCFSEQVALQPFDATPYNAALILSNAFGGAQAGLLLCHD